MLLLRIRRKAVQMASLNLKKMCLGQAWGMLKSLFCKITLWTASHQEWPSLGLIGSKV